MSATDPAALAALIAAALAATDTAARALWEAMGAPGEYRFSTLGSALTGYFDLASGRWGTVEVSTSGEVYRVRVYTGVSGDAPLVRHDGTLDSARAALAAYLGAS